MSDAMPAMSAAKITNRMLFGPIADCPIPDRTGFLALNTLKALPLDGDVSFAIKQLVKAGRDAAETFDEEKLQIASRYARRKDGVPEDAPARDAIATEPSGQIVFAGETDEERAANEKQFVADIEVLFDQPTVIPLRTFAISRMVRTMPNGTKVPAPLDGFLLDALDWFIVADGAGT